VGRPAAEGEHHRLEVVLAHFRFDDGGRAVRQAGVGRVPPQVPLEGRGAPLSPLHRRRAGRHAASITVADVQEWLAAQDLKPSSLKRYLATLRQVLDHTGSDPNPARDASLRLPRVVEEEPQPPSRDEVAQIVAHAPARWRLPLRPLEATGMQVGELSALRWGDVDLAGSRFRQPHPDQGPHWRPALGPDLRHRRPSLWHAKGVPARELAARAGHARASMSLDVYSHVLVDDDDEWS
jgi:integrase